MVKPIKEMKDMLEQAERRADDASQECIELANKLADEATLITAMYQAIEELKDEKEFTLGKYNNMLVQYDDLVKITKVKEAYMLANNRAKKIHLLSISFWKRIFYKKYKAEITRIFDTKPE